MEAVVRMSDGLILWFGESVGLPEDMEGTASVVELSEEQVSQLQAALDGGSGAVLANGKISSLS